MGNEDAAQRLELLEWQQNNRTRTGQYKYSPEEAGYGPEFCSTCDEDMPLVRREYGFRVCVPCKQASEGRR